MQVSPEKAIVGLGIFLALWYLVASIFNRRRGLTVYRWLQSGLDRLGGELAAKWLGSSGSGARIQVRQADAPFRDLEIVYLLASRELLPLFLVDLLRGKRDQLIVKARLRSSYSGEVEIVPSHGGLARQLRNEQEHPWAIEEGPADLLLATRWGGTDKQLTALAPLLDKYAPLVRRISWSKKVPHLIVILSLAGLYEKGGSAAGLFDDLSALAGSVVE